MAKVLVLGACGQVTDRGADRSEDRAAAPTLWHAEDQDELAAKEAREPVLEQ